MHMAGDTCSTLTVQVTAMLVLVVPMFTSTITPVGRLGTARIDLHIYTTTDMLIST